MPLRAIVVQPAVRACLQAAKVSTCGTRARATEKWKFPDRGRGGSVRAVQPGAGARLARSLRHRTQTLPALETPRCDWTEGYDDLG